MSSVYVTNGVYHGTHPDYDNAGNWILYNGQERSYRTIDLRNSQSTNSTETYNCIEHISAQGDSGSQQSVSSLSDLTRCVPWLVILLVVALLAISTYTAVGVNTSSGVNNVLKSELAKLNKKMNEMDATSTHATPVTMPVTAETREQQSTSAHATTPMPVASQTREQQSTSTHATKTMPVASQTREQQSTSTHATSQTNAKESTSTHATTTMSATSQTNAKQSTSTHATTTMSATSQTNAKQSTSTHATTTVPVSSQESDIQCYDCYDKGFDDTECPANGTIKVGEGRQIDCPSTSTCYSAIRPTNETVRGCTNTHQNQWSPKAIGGFCRNDFPDNSLVCFCFGNTCNTDDMTNIPPEKMYGNS